jgi:hypothetical protein
MNLNPYQQDMLNKISGGFKLGEMAIAASGRQTGKSFINQYIQQWHDMQQQQQPKCEIITQAEVDGKTWYTISCSKEVSMWIRDNGIEHDSWYEHIDSSWHIYKNMFDISEEFYMLVVLKFGK